jgi:tetratricopeptide (TPR) repeat protein
MKYSRRANLLSILLAVSLITPEIFASQNDTLDLDDSGKTVEIIAPEKQNGKHKIEVTEGYEHQAQDLFAKKDYHSTVETLKPHLDKLNRTNLILLARAYREQSDYVSEIRTLELALAKNPKDFVIFTSIGDARKKLKQYDPATEAYQSARAINSHYKPAADGLLSVLEIQENRNDARSLVNDMIKTFGDAPSSWGALCRLWSQDDFLEKSVEVCKMSTEKDSQNPENYVYLGASLRDLEKLDEAEKIYKSGVKKFPASESMQSAAGDFYLRKKDFVTSYGFYQAAVMNDANKVRAQVGLANSAFELQKNQEALDWYSKACKKERDASKDFRTAIKKLRDRKEPAWQARYETAVLSCK